MKMFKKIKKSSSHSHESKYYSSCQDITKEVGFSSIDKNVSVVYFRGET